MNGQLSIASADPLQAARLGSPVVVSSLLPRPPSDREVARRIVRHGYHDAGLLAPAAGDVGPRPHEQIRALWVDGTIHVDAALAQQLREDRLIAHARHVADAQRRAQDRAYLQAIATSLGVRKVTAHREPDYMRTLYRAHLEPEGTVWTGGPQVRIDDDDMPDAADRYGAVAYVAGRLRTALAEHKLDEETDARPGGAR